MYKIDYVLTGDLVEGEGEFPPINCVQLNIYFLQKSISPPEYVPQGPDKKFKL